VNFFSDFDRYGQLEIRLVLDVSLIFEIDISVQKIMRKEFYVLYYVMFYVLYFIKRMRKQFYVLGYVMFYVL
jgi:hypothetical protein